MTTELLSHLRTEAQRIHNACLWAAERQYAAETPWFYSNYALGITSTVLAATTGALSFWEWPVGRYLVAGFSVTVTVLSALLTFLDPVKKASTYHAAAKEYEALYHKTGYFCRVELESDNTNVATLEEKLREFSDHFNELNRSSLALSARAYRVAQKKIRTDLSEVVRSLEDMAEDVEEHGRKHPARRTP